VTRWSNGFSAVRNSLTYSRFILSLFLFVSLVVFAAGCKKSSPPPAASIRAISREIVFAARNATGGRAEVGMRPAYAAREPGKPQTLAYDDIYITVPLTREGAPDRAAHTAIANELARIAEFHHLERVALSGAPGLERFDYLAAGRRTQSVQLVTPLAGAARAASRQPRLAIVIDDLGHDRSQGDALLRLPYPLTLSVLPHLPYSGEIAEVAHRRGYEVLLHLPVASTRAERDEPVELHPGMDSGAVDRTFAAMLETVPYATGVNNHEGSLGTADPLLMNEVMALLHEHHLFFVDSRTTAATVAETAAHLAGVPATSRKVFLDDEQSAGAIRKQLDLAVQAARKNGSALAIGHPHAETLQVLSDDLPQLGHKGITLVFASELVH
jgi:polysaccharide deacetylase 2 family uncharacterized protein YibQ